MDIAQATREAAVLRLRPIVMTALVASLGLLPAAIATGAGTDSQRDLRGPGTLREACRRGARRRRRVRDRTRQSTTRQATPKPRSSAHLRPTPWP